MAPLTRRTLNSVASGADPSAPPTRRRSEFFARTALDILVASGRYSSSNTQLGRKNIALASDPIVRALQQMASQTVDCLVVVNEDGQVVGVATERDMICFLGAVKIGSVESRLQRPLSDLMTPAHSLVLARPDDSVDTCLSLMETINARHLPIIDDGKLLGIVSVRDLALQPTHSGVSKKAAWLDTVARHGVENSTTAAVAEPSKLKYNVHLGSFTKPHYKKRAPSGEDAHFIVQLPSDGLTVMGVADGVGSWFEQGIDPALYSQALMLEAQRSVLPTRNLYKSAAEHLSFAYEQVEAQKLKGSSTATLVRLTLAEPELQAAIVGDSGFVVLRQNTLDRGFKGIGLRAVFRSAQQQHYFNCPYQLGPSELGYDKPEAAQHITMPVEGGDVLILATDGLFDNMDEEEMLALASTIMSGEAIDDDARAAALAVALGEAAYTNSMDKTRDGPFAVLAKEHDICWGGGMPDDITIITAIVSSEST